MFSRTRQGFGRGHELGVDHVAGFDAVFDDFHVAHIRREQRLHAPPVDAVHDQHFVGGLLERVEEPGREHVAVAGHQRDQHAIRAAELGWCFTNVCMYSCLSGSCFVNEASMCSPRTATAASTAVTIANTTTIGTRLPKISFSSVAANLRVARFSGAGHASYPPVEAHGAHAAFARDDDRAGGPGSKRGHALAIVLLREPEGFARVAATPAARRRARR